MSISKKIKTINSKIKKMKAQYNLDRFLLYHQQMSVNLNFRLENAFNPNKNY